MPNHDYVYLQQPHSLFSNREERKSTRFKKNPNGDRGYGKQKYSSQKATSVSSSGDNSNNQGKMGAMPHSLLEKEIRHIMNQS